MPLVPPSQRESRFRYKFSVSEQHYPGWLTYELWPTNSTDRNLLLLRGTRDFLEPLQKEEYDALAEALRSSPGGRLRSAKNIVNQIADGRFHLPNVRIAVHRHGPVPVYVIPQEYKVDEGERERLVQIALYPVVGRKGKESGAPPFIPNHAEFRRSLQIGTDRLIQRYLEDVAEEFFDIEHHLGLRDVLGRAKEVETTLAESIKSKLRHLTPSAQSLAAFHRGRPMSLAEHLTCQLFEDKRDTIFTAHYARAYALYMLNELYGLIGIKPRTEKYTELFRSIKKQFNGLTRDTDFYEEALNERLGHMRPLRQALLAYHKDDDDAMARVESSIDWVQKFVGFASFVLALRHYGSEFGVRPETGRIFLSNQHDVGASEILRAQVIEWLAEKTDGAVQLLFFRTDAGPPVKPSIKRLIWMSDSVQAIIPAKTATSSGSSQEKRWLWIALEAEHGLLLDKNLLFFVQDDADIQRIMEEFGEVSAEEFLSPKASVAPAERRRRLVARLKDFVYGKFDIKEDRRSIDALDARVKRVLEAGVGDILARRHAELLIGYFLQFPPQAREVLSLIQILTPHPKAEPKSWIAKRLAADYPEQFGSEKAAANAVTATWELAKERELHLNGRGQRLVELHKRRYYTGRLLPILRELQPRADVESLVRLQSRILDEFAPRRGF